MRRAVRSSLFQPLRPHQIGTIHACSLPCRCGWQACATLPSFFLDAGVAGGAVAVVMVTLKEHSGHGLSVSMQVCVRVLNGMGRAQGGGIACSDMGDVGGVAA